MLILSNKAAYVTLFQTEKGRVIQDDHAHQFILEFGGKKSFFKVQEFLQFKKSIDNLNLQDLFLGEGPGVDIQIIHHTGSEHLFVFTLCELIGIKELLSGAATMIELNRILNDRLLSIVF